MMLRLPSWYHLRAYLYSKTLWTSHAEQVQKFLNTWNPKEKTLLIFGPSAGYSLPASFLQRFQSIIAVEPDPIARAIFEKRFSIKPTWIKTRINFADPEAFQRFQDFKGAVLFCNLLGQIPIHRAVKVKRVLKDFLKGRSYATYHDAMSGIDVEFDCESAPPVKATLAQMKSWIYVKNPAKTEVEVIALLAPDLFDAHDGERFQYWLWKITPRQSNLIEALYKNA